MKKDGYYFEMVKEVREANECLTAEVDRLIKKNIRLEDELSTMYAVVIEPLRGELKAKDGKLKRVKQAQRELQKAYDTIKSAYNEHQIHSAPWEIERDLRKANIRLLQERNELIIENKILLELMAEIECKCPNLYRKFMDGINTVKRQNPEEAEET